MQAVLGAVLTGMALVGEECFDVGWIFNLLPTVEGTGMGGDDIVAIEDAHGIEGGEHDQGASGALEGNGVIVEVESHVGCLGDVDLDTLLTGERIVGQVEQLWAFFVEDLLHGALAVLGTGPLSGAGSAPHIGLGVEVFEVAEASGAEEAVADEANQSLNAALLVAARRRHGPGLEAVVGGELEQRGVKPDGIAPALEDDALHVVVQDCSGAAAKHRERLDMAAHEVGKGCVEEEAHECVTGVAQHHDERHQGTLGAPDGEFAEVGPVELGLLAGQGAKAQVRLTGTTRSQLGDTVAEVVGPAGIATFLDHIEQARGGQGRELLQDLGDERDEGVDQGRSSWASALTLDTGLAQHALDAGVMNAELAGDGTYAPVLGEVVAQDLRLEPVADGHRAERQCHTGAQRGWRTRERRQPRRTKALTGRAQKWQCGVVTSGM